jgi:nicotinamide-nucleotide amidase
MRVELINTGNELLLGTVLNTHLNFLGEELFQLGLRIQAQSTIPDGQEIHRAVADAAARADLLIITGGLGPTRDDLTRDIVAELAQMPLEIQQSIVDHLEEYFQSRGYQLRENVKRQAQVPRGATVLENRWGTAPGLYLHPTSGPLQGKHLFLLPGPPRELRPMYEACVKPILQEIYEPPEDRDITVLRMVGVGESEVEHQLVPLLQDLPELELGFCSRPGEVDVRLIGSQEVVKQAREIAEQELHEYIFTTTDQELHEAVVELLINLDQKVVTVESCTGGLLANRLTNVPGSSKVFLQGYVTYSNEAKCATLEVPKEYISGYGAVSKETARAMAEKARRLNKADYALATTGIAGPSGGTEEKPVGTVYIALSTQGRRTMINKYRFPTDRETFKFTTTQRALDMLRRALHGLPQSRR